MNRRNFGALAITALVAAVQPANAQYRYNPEHRRPVEATIHDLEMIQQHSHFDEHQHERVENAVRHLHEFAERLREGGRFDKDKLDQAIGDVQHVIDGNHLRPEGHDMLSRDVNELRRLRQHFDDEHYRYEH